MCGILGLIHKDVHSPVDQAVVRRMTDVLHHRGPDDEGCYIKENIIPEDILNRKDKKGFPVPLTEWYQGPLKEFIQDILLSQKSRQRGIENPKEVETLLQQEARFGRKIWGLLCLELWFNTFIDK